MSVSVILPVYNAGAYLQACLDSLSAQTFEDFEIIAVNDGSTDDSAQVLNRHALVEPRLRVFHFAQNCGETQAMQFGMDMAEGEFFARMDNDDVCAPNRLALQVACLRRHSNVTVVGSNMALIGAKSGTTELPLTDAGIKANMIVARANIMNPTSMWRSEWFAGKGIRYGNHKNVSDFGMWVDCMLAGGVFMNLPEPLLQYRMHSEQASSDSQATNKGVQSIMVKLLTHWYPQLNAYQAADLARVCHGAGSYTLDQKALFLGFQAIRLVLDDRLSRYGEDRGKVRLHLLSRIEFWRDLIEKQNPGAFAQLMPDAKSITQDPLVADVGADSVEGAGVLSQILDEPVRRIVHSFDIFDTLLARNTLLPTDVFDRVEAQGVTNFKQNRLLAQSRSEQAFDKIYMEYQKITGIDSVECARVQALEIEAEKACLFLIKKQAARVQSGDILVSDMYLPHDVILSLLRHAGFEQDVTLFVSPAGKAAGYIWPEIQKQFVVSQHFGDNVHSDVQGPRKAGIATEHVTDSVLSELEQYLVQQGARHTALCVRQFRLSNPHPEHSRAHRLYEVQARFNLPVLLLQANQLRMLMAREGLTRLLLTMRDSCVLIHLMQALFPDLDVRALHASRRAYVQADAAFIDYVRAAFVPNETLIFDVHGAFKTGSQFFEQHLGVAPRVHLLDLASARYSGQSNITYAGQVNSNVFEKLNLAPFGTVMTVDEQGVPVRAPIADYPSVIGMCYQNTANDFAQWLRAACSIVRSDGIEEHCPSWGQVIARELSELGLVPTSDVLSQVAQSVANQMDLAGLVMSEHRSLTELANQFQSDKGNQYKCAHHYTQAYERLFAVMPNTESLKLLEIGLNRDAQGRIPSLWMWRHYFGPQARIYGMDIDPMFEAFHQPEQNLHIVIGDQSSPEDLAKIVRLTDSPAFGNVDADERFDLIIDDGYHASEHQQVTLAHLWQCLKPGGTFVIEDLHYQPAGHQHLKTVDLLAQWAQGHVMGTPFLPQQLAQNIFSEIDRIEFFASKSTVWPQARTAKALVFIHKRV